MIHFAAFKPVEESIRFPLKYYRNNACGLVNFLDLLQELGINNLVFSSSVTVYEEGVNAGVPLHEEFVSTTQKHITITMGACAAQNLEFGLTSPYGRTRFMC